MGLASSVRLPVDRGCGVLTRSRRDLTFLLSKSLRRLKAWREEPVV